MASPDYQVGAHFEALGEGVLMAPSKSIGYFFAISSCPEVRWHVKVLSNYVDGNSLACNLLIAQTFSHGQSSLKT